MHQTKIQYSKINNNLFYVSSSISMHLIKLVMAKIHRKLSYAYDTSNQTTTCLGYHYSAFHENSNDNPKAFLSPPPPPPPLPPSPSPPPLPPASPPPHEPNHSFLNSPYFIIPVSLLAGFIILLSFYVIIVKPFSLSRRRRSGANRPLSGQSSDEFQDDNVIFHPVWLITTAGLQQSMINSITICRYKSGEGLIEGNVCSVCLNEFQDNETLRLLPKCSHAFHIPCIDTWLRSHTNCPLCRAPILSDRTSSAPLGAVERNSENMNTDGVSLVENDENRTIDAEDQSVDQDEEVLKSSGCVDRPLNGNNVHILRTGSSNSGLSDSVFINVPYVHTDNHVRSSDIASLKDVQEHYSINVAKKKSEISRSFSRMVSLPIAQYMSERAVTIKRSLSCSERILHN